MSTALAYHAATKYAPETMAQHPGLDWAAQPEPFRDFSGDPGMSLADELPLNPNPFTGETAGPAAETPPSGEVDRAALARFLYFTYGVTGIVPQQPRSLHLRAAPSAGGLYPAELTLVLRTALADLPPGVYGFRPTDHALVPLSTATDAAAAIDAACYGNAAIAAAPVLIIASGVLQRSVWRYRARAYRRICLDTGHVLGNAGLVANALGLRLHLTAAFHDAGVAAAIGSDPNGDGALVVGALNRAGTAERPAWTLLPSGTGGAAGDDLAASLTVHAAGFLPAERPRWVARGHAASEARENLFATASAIELPADDGECPLAEQVCDAIVRRRSCRRFQRAPITLAQLGTLLAATYRPETVGLGHQPGLDPSRLLTFVAAAAVEGLPSGVWYYVPGAHGLRRLKDGLARTTIQYLCLGQELGHDAAVTIVHTADLPQAVAAWGDRAYRALHLDAGMFGQRLNLAAVAAGLGASGIGGFFDDHVNALLGLPEQQAVVYLTTIGVPAE